MAELVYPVLHPATPFFTRQLMHATDLLGSVKGVVPPRVQIGGDGHLPAYVPSTDKIKLRWEDDPALPHELFHWVYKYSGMRESKYHTKAVEEMFANLWQSVAGEWVVRRHVIEQRLCVQLLPIVDTREGFKRLWSDYRRSCGVYGEKP